VTSQELNEILSRPTMDVPTAGAILGNLCRNASYDAAHRGDIPTIKVGKRMRVATSYVKKQLGIE